MSNPYDSYLESRVLSASPVELVEMLYVAAIEAVGHARAHLASGDIAARGVAVTRASNIVGELVQSLDHSNGGALAADLQHLYDYVLRRLQAGHFEQSDAALAEVETLLGTLAGAWREIAASQRMVASAAAGACEEPATAGFSFTF